MTIYYAILATVLLAGGEWANAQEGESHIRVSSASVNKF